MRRSDPLDRLRAANPVPAGAVLPGPDRVLFARIVADVARPTPAPRRRVRPLVPVTVLLASLVGGTVAYALLRNDVTKPQTVACYEQADLEARTEVVSVEEGGPVAACAELWRRGVLGEGGVVPPLAVCTLASGVAAVFPESPGRDTCAISPPAPTPPSPGEPPLPAPPPSGDVNAQVLALRDALLPQFIDAACVDPVVATGIVRRELDRAGLGDWTVSGGESGFTAERPCATLSFRTEAREIVLVPSPPRR